MLKIDCAKCIRSRQYYNGRPYCIEHHPMAVCPRCGRQMGKFPNLSRREWCKDCQEEFLKNQLPLPLDTPLC